MTKLFLIITLIGSVFFCFNGITNPFIMASPLSRHDDGSRSWTSTSKSWPLKGWLSYSRLALKMSFLIENRQLTAVLDRMSVWHSEAPCNVHFHITKYLLWLSRNGWTEAYCSFNWHCKSKMAVWPLEAKTLFNLLVRKNVSRLKVSGTKFSGS